MAKFSVRARAVDMLGRQQIAGIPTALHELFKNAHDAYAKHVEVDYFRAQRLLSLRDDGDGMSRADFETKWLTLGTESKVGANKTELPAFGPRGLKPRRVLGEKGIGRLAIAAIGPVVLAQTRRDPTEAQADELTVALVHWGLFEIPGVDLGAIEIPIQTLVGGELPNRDTMATLVAKTQENIAALTSEDDPRRATLLSALAAIEDVNPTEVAAWLANDAEREGRKDLSLAGAGHGTHFLVAAVDPILDTDIDVKGPWGSSPFQRLLLGFGNTLAGEDAEFTAEFRDHHPDGRVPELIGAQSFFTTDEFVSADHHFDGRFDEFGQFVGTVQLYRGQPQQYILSWPQSAGRPTDCGPFSVKVGYLMGRQSESRLGREEHAAMYEKLNRLGGLYLYRDNVRVLPYGNSDYDFVNIEQRRTLSATDWFFSYRRMIGWIDINHDDNSALVEKAGREGFRENRAYRQFRDILENFFKQLAIDYFRQEADLGEDFRTERRRLGEDAERLKRREMSTRARRGRFIAELERTLAGFEAGAPARAVNELIDLADGQLNALAENDQGIAGPALLGVEADFLESLSNIESANTLTRPRGVALPKASEDAWRAYDRVFNDLRETVVEGARTEFAQKVEAFRSTHGLAIDRHRRANLLFEQEREASFSEVRKLRRQAEQAVATVDKAVREAMRDEVSTFQRYVEELMADLGREDLDLMPEDDAHERQRTIERALDGRLREGKELLAGMRDQLLSVAAAIGAGDDLDETTAALERRTIELQDQLDLYTDMAQAGSAVGIVGHEFENVATGVRRSVERLKAWADGTPEIREIYNDINSYFSELDGYLALFAPLSRRRYRRRSDVAGTYVEKYVNEALGSRLEELGVTLVVSDAFRAKSLLGILPTLLAAALNLVDNAAYWSSLSEEKTIRLDATPEGWLFSNTGPGVPLRMEERIFEFGISTKPGGRGMGLAISRDALRKIGLDLQLLNPGAQNAPIFRIGPAEAQ
ncbi:MAG: ATP-binding protein [Caulobacteraceae bacterium]